MTIKVKGDILNKMFECHGGECDIHREYCVRHMGIENKQLQTGRQDRPAAALKSIASHESAALDPGH